MKCDKVEGRLCGQEKCFAAATCLTRIAGFTVCACRSHHVCSRAVTHFEDDCDDKPSPSAKGVKEVKK